MQTATTRQSEPGGKLRQFWVVVILIALVMFGIRNYQIYHGLPAVQMGDENSDLSTTARLLTGELPKAIDRYTRTVVSNLEAIGFVALYINNAIKTGNTSVNSFREQFFVNRSDFIWISRFIIVLVSMLAIIALADLVRRLTNPLGGIIAALLMCFWYFWDLHSIYAMPDTLIASAIALYCWSVIYLLQSGSQRAYILTGITLAFVWLTKLSAAPVSVAVVLAHAFLIWNEGGKTGFVRRFLFSRHLMLFVAAFIIGNVALNPWPFLRPGDLLYEIEYRFNYGYGSPDRSPGFLGTIGGIISRSESVVANYIGLPMTVLMVLGILYAFVRPKQGRIALLTGGVVIWLAIAVIKDHFYKPSFWLPVLPFVVVFASIGAVSVVEAARKWKRAGIVIALLIITGIIVGEGMITAKVAMIMRRDYTFTQAQHYIEQNWAKNARVLMGSNISYSVPIARNEASIDRARQLGVQELETWSWWLKQPPAARKYEYDIYGPELTRKINTFEDVIRLIRDEKIQYVVEVDYCAGGVPAEPDAESNSSLGFPPLNQEVKQNLRLVASYTPFADGSTDCVVEIYDRVTILRRNELNLFYRPGPIIRLYQVQLKDEAYF
jgi:hypothetical protein